VTCAHGGVLLEEHSEEHSYRGFERRQECVPQMQGFGPLGKLHPEFFVSLCHMIIGSRLHRLAPSMVGPPLMTATSLSVPYRAIMVARYRDFCIVLICLVSSLLWLCSCVSYCFL